jgi:hypothetical protein
LEEEGNNNNTVVEKEAIGNETHIQKGVEEIYYNLFPSQVR